MPPASALLPDFQQLLRVAPHPYVVMDARFTLLWANDAYLRVTGRSAVDILDRNIFDAFPGGPHDPGGARARGSCGSRWRRCCAAAPRTPSR
ncbi:PAS domain-containing protein [Pseudoroseomonas cervicalis]